MFFCLEFTERAGCEQEGSGPSRRGELEVGHIVGGACAGEGLGAGKLLFCLRVHTEPMVDAAQEEGGRLGVCRTAS